MTSLPPGSAPVKARAALPAAHNAKALAALERFNAFEVELKDFSATYQLFDDKLQLPADGLSDASLARGEAMVAGLDALRRRWSAEDRPASQGDIATAVALATASFLNTNRADLELFSSLAAVDIAAEHPTRYELMRASSALRRKYEFLSIKSLLDELAVARRHANDLRERVMDPHLPALVASAKEDAPRLRKEAAAYRAALKRRMVPLPHIKLLDDE
jgi:hypothetical protein